MPRSDPAAAAPPAGDADALARALADAGHTASVRADGRLALLRAAPERFATREARTAAAALARAHGFTHVALVLDDDDHDHARDTGDVPAAEP